MEPAKGSSFPFRFTNAEIPAGDDVNAKVLAVDDQSYFHIAFCDPDIQKDYNGMLGKMQEQCRGRYSMPPKLARQTDMQCVIEYSGYRGDIYVRATVIKCEPDTKLVRCRLVDDDVEVEVHQSQIFHTTSSILAYPKFTLKCKLADMECFLNHPLLKVLYMEYEKNEWKPDCPMYRVEVLDANDAIPTVRLSTVSGNDLTDLLQQLIPTSTRLEYPALGVPLQVKVTSCDTNAIVWFQPMYKESLLGIVKTRLQLYTDGLLTQVEKTSEGSSWKYPFFEGTGQIFIYQKGQHSYRVRKLTTNDDDTVDIFYVDYGVIDNIQEDQIAPAKWIDPNLCFIPPQCLPTRFIGVKAWNKDTPKFNLELFWEFAMIQQCFLLLKKSNSSTSDAVFSHDSRIIPANFLDPHLNFFPPQCVPMRCMQSGVSYKYPPFTLQQFWTEARNKSVPWILKKYDIKRGQKGKFMGGLIPPEADFLVKSLESETAKTDSISEMCFTTQTGQIIRLNNSKIMNKKIDPPKIEFGIWPDEEETEDIAPKANSVDSGYKTEKSTSSEKSMPDINWVDWAITTFGDFDDDTVSSLSSASPRSSNAFLFDLNNNSWKGNSELKYGNNLMRENYPAEPENQ